MMAQSPDPNNQKPIPGMKCKRCHAPARFRFPSHNARFCDDCLKLYIERQVAKAIKKYNMLDPGGPVLVAVSGGKDSLVLWQVLHDLGYETSGLHLDLELGEFSSASSGACLGMAQRLGRPLHLKTLRDMAGFSLDQIVKANRRNFCSVCGVLKRHFMNRLCNELGAQTVASGHHLDDEAARLLGNMLRGHDMYLERQWPVLAANNAGFVKKIKPLCRLTSDELSAYAQVLELSYAQGDCPRSKGATLHFYGEAMELLEARMPGTKRNFYYGFLSRKSEPPAQEAPVGVCPRCGLPTYLPVCNACTLIERTGAWLAQAPDPDPGPAGAGR